MIVGVRMIAMLMGMHGAVVVPVKPTHGAHLSRHVQRRHQELVTAQYLDVGAAAVRAQ
jgi:hypothetical protein